MTGKDTLNDNLTQKEDLWKTIYSLSTTFFSMEPWKIFSESDVFGVQSPNTGMIYYVSIMGELGESYSLAAYQGDVALEQFWYLKEGESDLPVSTLMTIPHLIISLDKLKDISKEQVQYLKKLGINPLKKNLYPNIQQIVPGLLPVTPSQEILADLIHILEQSNWVVSQAKISGKDFIHEEGEGEFDYYVRKPEYSKDKLIWKESKTSLPDEIPLFSVTFDKVQLDRLMKLPPCRDVLEMELCPLLIPMREPGLPDFFPAILLLINQRTGNIEVFETLTPFPDYGKMVALLPEVIMKHSIRLGWRPAIVKYRSFHLGPIATFLTQHVKTKTIQTFDLPETDNALESLMDSLTKSQLKY